MTTRWLPPVAAAVLAAVSCAAALLAGQPAADDSAAPLIRADDRPYKRRPGIPGSGDYVFPTPPYRGI